MAHTGHGSVFNYSGDSGSTYTALAAVERYTPPGVRHEKIDDTAIADTEVSSKPSQPEEYTDATLTLFWSPDDASASTDEVLLTLAKSGATEYWRIDYPSSVGHSHSFQGYITDYTPAEVTRNGLMMMTITIAVISELTIGATP